VHPYQRYFGFHTPPFIAHEWRHTVAQLPSDVIWLTYCFGVGSTTRSDMATTRPASGVVSPQPSAGASALVETGQTLLVTALKIADAAQPVLEAAVTKGSQLWATLQPYHPEVWTVH
jgi:hypothetical protein